MTLSAEAYAILEGRHSDPFRYLGLHPEGGHNVVRAFLPHASQVEAIDDRGHRAELSRVHDAGLFEGEPITATTPWSCMILIAFRRC
jgi:1,4-alpha-glucan branching enzyme